MTEIVNQLCKMLHDDAKVVFLGVGSPLRADDSVGLYIVSELEKKLQPKPKQEYFFFLGESAPENFSGAIRNVAPSNLVIIDAAEMGLEPGIFSIIDQEQIRGTSFSTHMLPLQFLSDYLIKAVNCKVTVVGVQPKMLEFDYPMTPELIKSADQFIQQFCEQIKQ